MVSAPDLGTKEALRQGLLSEAEVKKRAHVEGRTVRCPDLWRDRGPGEHMKKGRAALAGRVVREEQHTWRMQFLRWKASLVTRTSLGLCCGSRPCQSQPLALARIHTWQCVSSADPDVAPCSPISRVSCSQGPLHSLHFPESRGACVHPPRAAGLGWTRGYSEDRMLEAWGTCSHPLGTRCLPRADG